MTTKSPYISSVLFAKETDLMNTLSHYPAKGEHEQNGQLVYMLHSSRQFEILGSLNYNIFLQLDLLQFVYPP